MEKLESISITENKFEDDVLGAFFEGIVRTGFKQEKGQFFTHTNIVRFVLLALELDIDIINRINSNIPTIPHIVDPSCGSGTFIIEAMKLITSSVLHPRPGALSVNKSRRAKDFVQEWFQPNAQNHNIQNRWARQFIYGVEANGDLALATKVNMIVHGDGNANIFKNDGLAPFAKFEPTKDNLNTRLQLEDGESKRANLPYKKPCNEQFDIAVGIRHSASRTTLGRSLNTAGAFFTRKGRTPKIYSLNAGISCCGLAEDSAWSYPTLSLTPTKTSTSASSSTGSFLSKLSSHSRKSPSSLTRRRRRACSSR
jgi:hypothetical protein